MSHVEVVLAQPSDLGDIQSIDRRASTRFLATDMAEIANDPPPDRRVLLEALRHDHLWVARMADSTAGFLLARQRDDYLHIDQLSVDPTFAGNRLGSRLVDACRLHASRTQARAVTLFTFVDIPWNYPYYRNLGFSPFVVEPTSPQLWRSWSQEAELGLARWPRVAMTRQP